jgi:hypothetical protein
MSGISPKHIRIVAANHDIIASAAIEHVPPGMAEQAIMPCSAEHGINASVAEDVVIASACKGRVVLI